MHIFHITGYLLSVKVVHLFVVLLAVLFPWSVLAIELPEVKDAFLVDLLNSFELLAEKKELPYAVRVLRLGEHGECDGTPQSCPQQTLYIAISTFGEDPEQKVYELPKAYGWEFVQWKAFPQKEGSSSFLIFEVKRKIISKNLAKGWWSESGYDVQVNPWKGSFREIMR